MTEFRVLYIPVLSYSWPSIPPPLAAGHSQSSAQSAFCNKWTAAITLHAANVGLVFIFSAATSVKRHPGNFNARRSLFSGTFNSNANRPFIWSVNQSLLPTASDA